MEMLFPPDWKTEPWPSELSVWLSGHWVLMTILACAAAVIAWRLRSGEVARVRRFARAVEAGEVPLRDADRLSRRAIGRIDWRTAGLFGAIAAFVQIAAIGNAGSSVVLDPVYIGGMALWLLSIAVCAFPGVRGVHPATDEVRCGRCGYPCGRAAHCVECGRQFEEVSVVPPGWRVRAKWMAPGGGILSAFAFGVLVASVVLRTVPLPVHVLGERWVGSGVTYPGQPNTSAGESIMFVAMGTRWSRNGSAPEYDFSARPARGGLMFHVTRTGYLIRQRSDFQVVFRRGSEGEEIEMMTWDDRRWRPVTPASLRKEFALEGFFDAPPDGVKKLEMQRIALIEYLFWLGPRPDWLAPSEGAMEYSSRLSYEGLGILGGVALLGAGAWWFGRRRVCGAA